MQRAITRHPLLSYFLLAFSLDWAYELLVVVLGLPPGLALLPAVLGPVAAAFVITAVTESSRAARKLLASCLQWHVPIRWYVVALAAVPVLMWLCVFALPGAAGAFRPPGLAALATYGASFLLNLPDSLGEEPGWRGFALPRLQRRHGPVTGTLILAPIWALWHLPPYVIPGLNRQFGTQGAGQGGRVVAFMLFLVLATAVSVIITWVFNNTQGSLLPAILLHTSINTSPLVFFPSLSPSGIFSLRYELAVTVAAAMLAGLLIVGSRGHLGYCRVSRQGSRL